MTASTAARFAAATLAPAATSAPRVHDVTDPALPLPPWARFDPRSGIATWEGGIRTVGDLMVIPGRTIDRDHLDEARRHALAVLAAVAHIEQQETDRG